MTETLYHYCSSGTFDKILFGKCIRLSWLSLSNDTMEGRWLHCVADEVCKAIGLSDHETSIVFAYFRYGEGIGFCMSRMDDMLSQWRGYADDAHGFCIGFSKDYLEQKRREFRAPGDIRISLDEVLYDIKEQRKILSEAILSVRDQFASIHDPQTVFQNGRIHEQWWSIFRRTYYFKNPAFAEEAEWRLYEPVDAASAFLDFHVAQDRIVPFRQIDIETDKNPIVSVTIGPKNVTPPDIVSALLKKRGYHGVEVRRSAASYR